MFLFRSLTKLLVLPFCGAIAMAAFCGCVLAQDDGVRINQIQIIGTHNSYHSGFVP